MANVGTTSETACEDGLRYAGVDRRAAAIIVDAIVPAAAFSVVGPVIGALTDGLVSRGFEPTGVRTLEATTLPFYVPVHHGAGRVTASPVSDSE